MVDETISIESLMLANHVESANGLLYISGGGWTDHHRQMIQGNPPPVSHFGIALVLAVPWNLTNRQHNLSVEIRHEDAQDALVSAAAHISVGRMPTLRPGTIQYPTIALPINLVFPQAGGYVIVARVNGSQEGELDLPGS